MTKPERRKANHVYYMEACLELAKQARAEGNWGVGAIVVKDDEIIARAYEKRPNSWDVTAHAELLAVRQACMHLQSHDLRASTLYTTVEPCWMCAYTIREAGIGTVVIGATNKDVGALSSKYAILSDPAIAAWSAPPRIIMGVLEKQCITVLL